VQEEKYLVRKRKAHVNKGPFWSNPKRGEKRHWI